MPSRAILRVGVVGGDESDSSSVDGIVEWATERLEEDSPEDFYPSSVEIHDGRQRRASPTPGELAKLYEATNERVRWYNHEDSGLPTACDLVVLDQLGFREPTGGKADSRSPVSLGTLTRVRIREDFNEAKLLRESRVMIAPEPRPGIESIIEVLCASIEQLSLRDENVSHLEFVPNQDALGQRLDQATFVAVSSNRLDPACLIRGAEGKRGHLWDYELPAIVGGEEGGAGYYLIARPTPAMQRTVLEATRAVGTVTPPDAEQLLGEVSKRGIPVLKRLAAGGSESRGELGTLLAVRLLQDCFRGKASAPRIVGFDATRVALILPVDPYAEIFRTVGRATSHDSGARPDLLLVRIDLTSLAQPTFEITPIEIKFRASADGSRGTERGSCSG